MDPKPDRNVEKWLRGMENRSEGALDKWERRFAEYLNVPDAAAVNSGRRALTLALEHLRIKPGDEIIVPAYTFGEILPPLQALGAKLIPADIDPETLNATPETIEKRVTNRTRAILALHIFGAPCKIDAISKLATSKGIALIEDCAHALGSTIDGNRVGVFGDAAFFSFEMTKPVNTFGGGMLVARDPDLLRRVREENQRLPQGLSSVSRKIRATRLEQTLLRTGLAFPFLYLLATPSFKHAMERLYRRTQDVHRSHERYSSVQAALGLRQLETLDDRLRERRRLARLLRDALRPEARLQRIPANMESTHYFCVAILPRDAEKIRRKLLIRGVDAGVMDEIMDDCAAILGFDDCPGVKSIYRRAIALPIYDGISESVVLRVAEELNKLL
jgi:dTDP-4-amino-4,6-dideoxygalactose transaminase